MRLHKKISILLLTTMMAVTSVQAATLKCINENNTNSVPLRVISEEFGANVGFDQAAKKITITKENQMIELVIGSKTAAVNGKAVTLQSAPKLAEGTTYVPIRFISEALGAMVEYSNNVLSVTLDGNTKQWTLQQINTNTSSSANNSQAVPFKDISQVVNGKKVTAVSIDMSNSSIKAGINTAGNKVTQAAAIKMMAAGAKLSINGTYFAAYNGDTPLPDGTIVKNGKILHITDIGSTIGFTSDNKVLIDFVKTRVKGYVNGAETWTSYRVNRHTPDASATIIYTPEFEGNITLPSGWVGIVCVDGKVLKYATETRSVPSNGFILVTAASKKAKYPIGASVNYEVDYTPTYTSKTEWAKVTNALSAGPSLMINGQLTGSPADESFTEAKILTQTAQRSFIGVTSSNKVIVGTVSANISELKGLVKTMGLQSAMCLDGGASSGLYYNGSYLTSPGRNVNNCINFYLS